MKAWLCQNPVRLQIVGVKTSAPKECLGLLAVYKTKKQGREIHGRKAQFTEVDWPLLKGE